MKKLFTRRYIWDGGFYELAINLGEHSDNKMADAINAIWTYPDLFGCFLRNDNEPSRQDRVLPKEASEMTNRKLYGVATLPNSKQAPCVTIAMPNVNDDTDWLVFGIPMEALDIVYNVGAYPFDSTNNPRRWEEPLDEWLANIGTYMYQFAPYLFGVVGMEGQTLYYSKEILTKGIPQIRHVGYLWPRHGSVDWYPVNDWI